MANSKSSDARAGYISTLRFSKSNSVSSAQRYGDLLLLDVSCDRNIHGRRTTPYAQQRTTPPRILFNTSNFAPVTPLFSRFKLRFVTPTGSSGHVRSKRARSSFGFQSRDSSFGSTFGQLLEWISATRPGQVLFVQKPRVGAHLRPCAPKRKTFFANRPARSSERSLCNLRPTRWM